MIEGIGAAFIAAFLILLTPQRQNIREIWTFIAAFILFVTTAMLLPSVFRGEITEQSFFTLAPGVDLTLRSDALAAIFALMASVLWIITSFYSVGYMRALKEKNQARYFASFAVCVGATVGVAFAGNLLTFFIFYELLTLATYPLVAHKETKEAIAAGRKYLIYTLTGGALILAAIAICWIKTGELDFRPGGFLAGQLDVTTLRVLFTLFIAGMGVKAAIMPLHGWLPSAMVAPVPVSALLHAVAVVKAGVFGILRVMGYVFGFDLMDTIGVLTPLAALAGFTILAASIIALRQDNLKKRLAYSTISQLSYIILGAALNAPAALLGALLHLVNHAFMKITLFFCAGAIYTQTHKENISELKGIGHLMPVTMAAFAVASLGLIGLPLSCGFISKLHLVMGAAQAQAPQYLALYLLSALMNAAYFMPIVINAFFVKPEKNLRGSEAPCMIRWPIIATSCVVLILGVMPGVIEIQMQLASLAQKLFYGG